MNKILSLFILLALTLSVLTVSAAPKGKHAGIVNRLEGKAEAFYAEETQPRTLEIGSKIYVNDKIVTGKNSKAQILLRNDCVFTIAEQSELIITKDMYSQVTGKRETVVSLLKGKLRSVAGKSYKSSGSKYEVHTRTAIAGVRGTENLVETSENPPLTNVYGIDNTTNVRNSNQNIQGDLDLGPGNGAKVPLDCPPEPFEFDFDDPALQDLLGGTTVGGGSGDVEDDVNMGSFMGGPDAFGEAEHPDIEPFDIEEKDKDETPPFDQMPDQDPNDLYDYIRDETHCGGYEIGG